MHPFSSDPDCLFKITHFRAGDGLKIERKNPAWFYCMGFVWSIVPILLIWRIGVDVYGWNDFVSFMLSLPCLGLFLYISIRANGIFHTDAAQLIGGVTIADEIMAIELLDGEEGGWYRGFWPSLGGDKPYRGEVVDLLNISLSKVIGYDWKVDNINGQHYYSLESYIELGGEMRSIQITPNFRNQKDVITILALMAPHLDAVEKQSLEFDEMKTFDESDPSYA